MYGHIYSSRLGFSSPFFLLLPTPLHYPHALPPALPPRPAGYAKSLYCTVLRHGLPKDDAPLGPWPPGRDATEDALRVYVGEWMLLG